MSKALRMSNVTGSHDWTPRSHWATCCWSGFILRGIEITRLMSSCIRVYHGWRKHWSCGRVLIWPLRGWLLWGNGPKPDSNLTRPALLFLVFCSLSGSNGRSLRSKWYRFLAKTLESIFIVFWTKINPPIKNRSLYMLNSINYLPPILESILPKLSVLIELKQTDPRDPPWLQHSDLLVSKY